MDRKEVYSQIKSLGLEEDVKKKFGKNFTQVSTTNLVAMIESNKKKVDKKKSAVSSAKSTAEVNNLRRAMEGVDYKAKYEKALKIIAKFVTAIPDDILTDVTEITKNMAPEKAIENIEFSNADIDKMFK